MRILPTPPPSNLQTSPALRPALVDSVKSLTAPGQVLSAVVKQALGEQRYTLQLSGGEVVAHSPRSLPIGERLQLQVVQALPGQAPVVRPLETPPQPLTDLLRQVLPRQQDAAMLLQHLAAGARSELPQPLGAALRHFLDQLPRRQDLMQAAGLQTAIQQAGLFHETALLTGQPLPDLKTQLLALATQLTQARQQLTPEQLAQPLAAALARPVSRPLPARTAPVPGSTLPGSLIGPGRPEAAADSLGGLLLQLLEDADGLLARIESHQLMVLQQREQGHLHWYIDLPLRPPDDGEVLRLQISREGGAEADPQAESAPWCVTLGFDLDALGPVVVKAVLAETVHLAFHAERSDTLSCIEATAAALGRRLADLTGLPVEVSARQGLPHPDTLSGGLPPLLRAQA